MNIEVTIDYDKGESGGIPCAGELTIENWDEQVKLQCPLFEGPIYIDRGELLRALAALEAGSS